MNRFRSTLALASATQYLVLTCIVVYAIQILQQPKAGANPLSLLNVWQITGFEATFGLLTPPQLPQVFWQLVTYMFLHGSLWHILFNMYVLWWLGHLLERVWGWSYFLSYYFMTGIGAGLTAVAVSLISPQYAHPLCYSLAAPPPECAMVSVGASGAIYGLLLAFGMLFPHQPIYLILIPVPIPAKYAVMLLGGFALFAQLTGILPVIGHIAHLGGLLFGLLFLKGRGWLGKLLGR